MNPDLVSYYKERAKEYERIYFKPERQEDLRNAAHILQELFSGKNVYEIACGTGYWTEKIAQTARSVFATDINESVIDIARQKSYSKNNVSFLTEDLYTRQSSEKYTHLFAGFIWSHIKIEDLDKFIQVITGSLLPGGSLVFIDNKYVEGSNHPITHTDENGNTFQTRKLDDGSSHIVLKNFPDEKFLQSKFAGFASECRFINLKYFWIFVCKLKEA